MTVEITAIMPKTIVRTAPVSPQSTVANIQAHLILVNQGDLAPAMLSALYVHDSTWTVGFLRKHCVLLTSKTVVFDQANLTTTPALLQGIPFGDLPA